MLADEGGPGTTINGGTLAQGSLEMIVPASYIPGVPFLVRLDLKDSGGKLNRGAWNTTATLTGNNGVTITPPTITLTNGMGSALVAVGSTSGGGTQTFFSYGMVGGGGAVGVPVGTGGSTWKYRTDLNATSIAAIPATWKNPGFADGSWPSGVTQIGYGDGNDENLRVAVIDYNEAAADTPVPPSHLFRNTFTIADISQIASVTGQIRYDDAAIVYVNGTEILRTAGFDTATNVPQVPLTTYADFGGAATTENATANLTVPLNLLHNGVNTIAVQVHQHDAGSTDMTFDLRLQGALTGSTTDPGNFTMTASAGPLSVQKTLTSLGASPAMTNVSGTLPAGVTTWSGVMNVTGDVTVPAGATLNVAAGTHVLMTGTSAAGDTNGTDIIVNGTMAINGTAAQPVSIACSDAGARWGQILLSGAQPTVANFLLMSRGGHSPGAGHTGRGPMWRLTGSNLTLNDSAVGDGPAKGLYSSGTCNFTMQRTLMARMITGPETEDGTAILIEDSNIQEILPNYRESNSLTPDDEDCLYVHNGSARSVITRRAVFARCGDDVFDCLGGPITVEDCIIRDGWDKGLSLLNNTLTITGTQIIDCDKGIAYKNSSAGATRNCYVTRCTIVGEEHDTTLAPWGYSTPPSSPDPDIPNTAFWTQWKPPAAGGTPTQDGVMNLTVNSSVFYATQPLQIDNGPGQYTSAPTTVNYTITRDRDAPATPAWPGTGNSNADPLFVNLAADDYHLAAGSPAINAGDPALLDPDNSRADMGALPFSAGSSSINTVRWTLAGSPYHITANTTVPPGLTLQIDPGVCVFSDQNVRLTVNGRILAEGTAASRIVFSHVPGAVAPGDADPLKFGTQTGPPKWGGVRVVDSMAQENIFRYCDFINAQGTDPATSENYGSVGFIRSWGWVDHVTFAGSHLRLCYGRNCKLTVTYSTFPDMFIFDPVLNRIEEPTTDFIAAADNRMEPLKVEFPTTDPEVSGANAANFPNGLPLNGHWRIYFNQFNGNRGHQDVFDGDSGRWSPRDANNHQTNGQFMMDCRYNHFRGLAGDEHIDLGGDAYIASNIFENAKKDFWTNDTGYSNALSSGDKGDGTTIMVVRNVCYDLDHVINCKARTATIFEHNTVANLHADFQFQGETVTQNVVCAPVNFFIPGDGANPTVGEGAYMGFNLISNVPHMFSGPDANAAGNGITTEIEFFNNLLNQIGDPNIGPNHPGGFFSGTYGPNQAGAPGFVNPAAEDYSLLPGSPARGTAPGGLDYGASIPEWAYVIGGPSGTVSDTAASFIIGGPGIVAYKWRLDGGTWSASIQIGSGGLLPRGPTPTVRQDTLGLTGLTDGPHTLEVLGQDMAGNWQGADPARLYDGQPQATGTTRTWTVETGPNDLATWLNNNGLTMADLLLDGDKDGLTNLVEFSLSTQPASSSGADGAAAAPVSQLSSISGNQVPALLASLPTSALPGGFGSSDVSYIFQDSTDFITWRDLLRKSPTDAGWQNVSGTGLVLVESLGTAGGRAQFLLKSPDSISSTGRKFLRLKIVLLP